MSFQTPITVCEAIDQIHRKQYLLPSIQREFIWRTDQIERLFDSLMRRYPIGSFLFWYVDRKRIKDFQYYEFLRNYHELDNQHNPKADVSGEEAITAVLDGQQRLTALYIGLKGTYAFKLPWKRWDNPQAFPKRKLFLNLLAPASDEDLEYNFKFLTDEEAKHSDSSTFWFRIGDILELSESWQINDYLADHELISTGKMKYKFANKALFRLQDVIHRDKIINYFLEKDDALDKVLNIFVRANSGGTPLSYSDLLLSIATAQWKEIDARDEIVHFVEEVNKLGNGFNFDKDFVLKSCLVLSDIRDTRFKVDNFNRANMLKIEKLWDQLKTALRLAVRLVASFGYTRDTLTSNAAVIPIAYFMLKRMCPSSFVDAAAFSADRKSIRKWLILCLLKRVFGGQPDAVLVPLREILAEEAKFPLSRIVERFRGGNRSLSFTDDEIENLFFYRHGQNYTFSALALLYPSLDFKNIFHIDHIHPRSLFTQTRLRRHGLSHDDIAFCLEHYNEMPNLQLLGSVPNQEKRDTVFQKWLYEAYPDKAERKEFMARHSIPNIDLSVANFKAFFTERKRLMKKAYESLLSE